MNCYGANIPDMSRVPRAYLACGLFLSLVLLTSCKSTKFELELRPDGDSMQRKVTTWVQDAKGDDIIVVEYPAEELQHFADIYGFTVPEELVEKHVFEKSFTGNMPDDLGGSGWYLYGETTMGSTSSYFERFGDDQIAPDLRSREMAANRTVDLLVAWLDSRYIETPGFPEFRDFIDTVVREDLWNLVLYAWGYDLFAGEMQPDDSDLDEDLVLEHLGIRAAAYLAEHGYFDPLQAVQYLRAVHIWEETDDPKPALELIARSIASKMGVPSGDPLPTPLEHLVADWESMADSLDDFSNNSEEVRAMVEEWNLTEREPFDLESGDQSTLEQLLDRAILPEFDIFGSNGDQMKVTLHSPVEPIYMNGKWHEDGTVKWTEYVRGRRGLGESLPDIIHATWSEPATEYQTEHLGLVVLEDESLAEYVLWHTGLPADVARQWDEFLASLEPGPELVTKLRQFCFGDHEERCEEARKSNESPYYVVEQMASSLLP
jgi:hypothetical protein